MLRKAMLSLLLVCAMVVPAMAADYPSKPITIIVPFAAGGETDLVARLLAAEMSAAFKQNVVVKNVVSAVGMSGMSDIANAKPDGYTLGLSPFPPLAVHPHMRTLPYSLDSFDFIGRIITAPMLLITQKSSPWNTVEDMIADVQANPNKYSNGIGAPGTVGYLAMKQLNEAYSGLKFKEITFTGDADALQAMAANRIQMYSGTAGSLTGQDAKALVVLGETRDSALPDVPTFVEKGKNIIVMQWFSLIAPANLPKDVLSVLDKTLAEICQSTSFNESLNKLGLKVAHLHSAKAKEFAYEQSAMSKKLLEGVSQ